MARISAVEAEQIVRADLENQRRMGQANLPVTPKLMNDLTGKGFFRICNVGPWPYHIERGSIYLDIPGYDAKKDKAANYAASVAMPAVRQEAKVIGGGGEVPLEYGYIFDDGRQVALEMIGIGFGLPKHASLMQYGVFVPAGAEPTKEELTAARQTLEEYADRLIQEAREAFDKGRDEWNRTRSERHIWAGQLRGIQEKWVAETHQEQSVRCEMCGTFNPAGIAKCKCGYILDIDLFAKLERQQAEVMELVKGDGTKRK